MKKSNRLMAFIVVCMLSLSLVGCSGSVSSAQTDQRVGGSGTESPSADLYHKNGNGYVFTDDAGREVTLPDNIERIAPTGPLAQVVLYTLCPDKMAGWASEFSDEQKEYINEKYSNLPVFGNFYGKTLNLESVMKADPQVIIDIGEAKEDNKQDLDEVQEKTGIPTIFVRMEMDNMSNAYLTLGRIVEEDNQASELSAYVSKTLNETKEKLEQVPEAERKTVYYGESEGLSAVVAGTIHADVIDYAGGKNVAEVEATTRGGGSDISMEQLLLWNPDVILFGPDSIYSSVKEKSEWQQLNAIKNDTYYEIPFGLYNWVDNPASVNRVIGIKWLSNLLYPTVFNYDMIAEAQTFYSLFYHSDITEAQARELLSHSTYK